MLDVVECSDLGLVEDFEARGLVNKLAGCGRHSVLGAAQFLAEFTDALFVC